MQVSKVTQIQTVIALVIGTITIDGEKKADEANEGRVEAGPIYHLLKHRPGIDTAEVAEIQ